MHLHFPILHLLSSPSFRSSQNWFWQALSSGSGSRSRLITTLRLPATTTVASSRPTETGQMVSFSSLCIIATAHLSQHMRRSYSCPRRCARLVSHDFLPYHLFESIDIINWEFRRFHRLMPLCPWSACSPLLPTRADERPELFGLQPSFTPKALTSPRIVMPGDDVEGVTAADVFTCARACSRLHLASRRGGGLRRGQSKSRNGAGSRRHRHGASARGRSATSAKCMQGEG